MKMMKAAVYRRELAHEPGAVAVIDRGNETDVMASFEDLTGNRADAIFEALGLGDYATLTSEEDCQSC